MVLHAKIKMLEELCSFLETLGLFPCLFQPLEATPIPRLKAPSSILELSTAPLSLLSFCTELFL